MNLVEGLKAAFSFLSSVFIVISVCFLGSFDKFKNFPSMSHLLFAFFPPKKYFRLVPGVQVVPTPIQSRARVAGSAERAS